MVYYGIRRASRTCASERECVWGGLFGGQGPSNVAPRMTRNGRQQSSKSSVTGENNPRNNPRNDP
eukprot:6463769-Pyramimonas_sp.AAC.1